MGTDTGVYDVETSAQVGYAGRLAGVLQSILIRKMKRDGVQCMGCGVAISKTNRVMLG